MKARAEAELQSEGAHRPRAQARPRRDPRHRVRGAAAAARPRATRRDGAIAARRSTRSTSSRPAGYVEAGDAPPLADAYRFLRTVEHRLQLWDEQQTHTLPADGPALVRLARVLGYRDTPQADALDQFDADHRAHQATVRTIHERLFFAPILDTLAGAGPLPARPPRSASPRSASSTRPQTRAALRELTQGLTRSSRVMQQLLPVDPRLAVGDARSRPRAAPAAPARRGPDRAPPRSAPRSGRRPARPSASVASSARAGWSATRCSASPNSSSCSATTTWLVTQRVARRAALGGARDAGLARRHRPRGAPDCAGSSGASCCGSARRDLLGLAAGRGDRPRARRPRRRVRRSRARVIARSSRRCRSP